MNPECERFVPLIARSADGTLEAAEAEVLEAHLASCAECRRAFAEQRAVSRAMEAVRLDAGPRDFAARVRARVAPAPGLIDLVNWRVWTFRLAPVAALLGMLAWYPAPASQSAAGTTESVPAALDEWAGTRAEVAGGVLGIGPGATTDRDALLAAALGETR